MIYLCKFSNTASSIISEGWKENLARWCCSRHMSIPQTRLSAVCWAWMINLCLYKYLQDAKKCSQEILADIELKLLVRTNNIRHRGSLWTSGIQSYGRSHYSTSWTAVPSINGGVDGYESHYVFCSIKAPSCSLSRQVHSVSLSRGMWIHLARQTTDGSQWNLTAIT